MSNKEGRGREKNKEHGAQRKKQRGTIVAVLFSSTRVPPNRTLFLLDTRHSALVARYSVLRISKFGFRIFIWDCLKTKREGVNGTNEN
jgi:hypothetical protein